MTEDPILTVPEVALKLRVPEGTLRWWRFTGEGGPESFKIGRRVVYHTSVVERYISDQASATSSQRSA